jgi:hypothetical protein
MAQILEVKQRANGTYIVVVQPNDSAPGRGQVINAGGRGTPWASEDGNPVDVAMDGPEPFTATQES